ncbi:MAG: MFS transporter, partial [Candidatus Sericytochromatia bacterium]|nr:MFS transporter [Candidatus Sericytochromatia bacterium]
VAAAAIFLLPPMRRHLESGVAKTRMVDIIRRPAALLCYTTTAVVMIASFVLIPNIAAYVQGNLGYPRAGMGFLYLAGGIVSFFATMATGRMVDRFGSFRTGTVGAVMLLVTTYMGFYDYAPALTVVGLFMAFMLAMSIRNVAFNTLISKVPPPHERAQFMSINSAVQHGAAAAGAILSSRLLSELPSHRLGGIDQIALVSMGMTLCLPLLLWAVERLVKRGPGVGQTTPLSLAETP